MKITELLELTERAKNDEVLRAILEAVEKLECSLERKWGALERAERLYHALMQLDSGAPNPPPTA
jgi:hypothetical protein